jgi:hypothetical protein
MIATLAVLLAATPSPTPAAPPPAATAPRPQLLLVLGAAGAPEYAERFGTAASHWQKAATRGGANITLVGRGDAEKQSDREALKQAIGAAAAVKDAPLWLVLIGHGTYDGRVARFNLRGADVTEKDMATWLAPLRRPLIFVNTASASAPFLKALAGPDRVLVTATRSGNEVNAPRFGGWLAEALADLRADLDRDGGVSLLEAFLHAAKRVERSFTEESLLATEHALLDDNGDGVGTASDSYRGLVQTDTPDGTDVARDGARARLVNLIPPPPERALPEPLRRRRDQLEGQVLSLRERRAKLPESVYYARLERILYEIARLYQRADRQAPAADAGSFRGPAASDPLDP